LVCLSPLEKKHGGVNFFFFGEKKNRGQTGAVQKERGDGNR